MSRRRGPWTLLLAAIASAALIAPALSAPRFVDDFYLHARVAGRLGEPTTFAGYEFFWRQEQIRELSKTGFLPWWTDPGLRLRFLRPLTSATHALDVAMHQGAPALARAHSLLWLLGLLAGAWALFRRWLAPGAAALAIVVYAIAGHHGLSSAWIAARHALVSGAFGTLALWAWLRWREDGAGRHALTWGIGALLGLAGGEVGLGALVLCASHGLFGREQSLARRAADAAPALVLAATYLIAYGALGYGARGSEAYVEPLASPLEFVRIGAGRWLALLAQLLLGLPANLYIEAGARPLLWLGGTVAALVLAVGMLALRPHQPHHDSPPVLSTRPAWLVVGGLVALVPAGAAIPGGRALVLSALGFTALVSALLWRALLLGRAGRRPALPVLAALGVLALGQLGVSPLARLALAAGIRDGADKQARIAERWSAPCRAGELRVLLSAPEFASGVYAPLQLSEQRREPLAAFRLVSMAPIDVRARRVDEHTLRLAAAPGEAFFQSQWEQLHSDRAPSLGEGGRHDGLSVRVSEVDEQGRPSELEVHTNAPLDAQCWLSWRDGTFTRVSLPKVSNELLLPTEPGPLSLPR